MTSWITICDTCKRDDWAEGGSGVTSGEAFAEMVEQAAEGRKDLRTRRHSCLMGCTRSCNVAIQAAGKLNYTLGEFAPTPEAAQAVVEYAALHAQMDLSTGINPVPYPVGDVGPEAWTALPDHAAQARLIHAARAFWGVPEAVDIVAAPGASALIAQMPTVFKGSRVKIPAPTYNEHAAAFRACGWQVVSGDADLRVLVHPNNPDGRLWNAPSPPAVIDESFCDVTHAASHVGLVGDGVVVLKSFGKFWGLAGMRLGFAMCTPDMAAKLRDGLGPWAVSGPALEIGARALEDITWARDTRVRLAADMARLNSLMGQTGAKVVGSGPAGAGAYLDAGVPLFGSLGALGPARAGDMGPA